MLEQLEQIAPNTNQPYHIFQTALNSFINNNKWVLANFSHGYLAKKIHHLIDNHIQQFYLSTSLDQIPVANIVFKINPQLYTVQWETILRLIQEFNMTYLNEPFKMIGNKDDRTIIVKIYFNFNGSLHSLQRVSFFVDTLNKSYNLLIKFNNQLVDKFIKKKEINDREDQQDLKMKKIEKQRKNVELLRKKIISQINKKSPLNKPVPSLNTNLSQQNLQLHSYQNNQADTLYKKIKKQLTKQENKKLKLLKQKNVKYDQTNIQQQKKNILKLIQFISIQTRKWEGDKTINSCIEMVYAHYNLLLGDSIHPETNQVISEGYKQKCQGLIVCKKPEKGGENLFLTEFKILKYLRNYHCQQISSYYIAPNIIKTGNQEEKNLIRQVLPQKLYSEYYEKKFNHQKFKTAHYLKIIGGLIEGLFFLHRRQILHRDLKPQNIMIDEKITPKIIDFGSAHPWSRNTAVQQSLKLNEPLSTTIYYNIPYLALPDSLKSIYNPTIYERHPNFDLHAFGKIVHDVLRLETFGNPSLGSYLHQNLVWTVNNLMQIDPEYRMNTQQVAIFVKQLIKFFLIQNKS